MRDHEAPWKELFEQDAEAAVGYFCPAAHADLDWARDVDSLEQEFRPLAPEAPEGKRVADKLLRARTRRKPRDPRYLHFEVQRYFEEDFARRVHVYNLRAEHRYGQPVASFAILLDDDLEWLPASYESDLYGTRRTFTFSVVKVAAYRPRLPELMSDPSPVALFVAAYLRAKGAGKDFAKVGEAKREVLARLLQLGLSREDRLRWYGYYDWLLWLPREYNLPVWEWFQDSQEEAMKFVTFAEERGIEKGIEQGIEKGRRQELLGAIGLGLDLKFGAEGAALLARAEKVEALAQLQAVRDAIKPAASLDDVRKLLPEEPTP